MQRLLVLLLMAVFSVAAHGQGGTAPALTEFGVRIDPDRRVMLVLAALEMAETDAQARVLNTPLTDSGARFRERLISESGVDPELRKRISTFVAQHKRRNAGMTDPQIVSQFISMAYTLSPPPQLADPAVTVDLPGSVLDVLDFAPLVRELYRRSQISSKLEEYVKEYRLESDGVLRSSTREMVSELLEYMHTRPRLLFTEKRTVEQGTGRKKLQKVETREHERRFLIVPERLAPRGTITFLNIRDDYMVIVPPDADLIFSEARRAYLQFVLDPLVLSNAKDITAMRTWAKPLLDEQRQSRPNLSPDIVLAVTRSLVAAVDHRQAEHEQVRVATAQARDKILRMRTDDEKRAVTAELERLERELADETALRLYEDFQNGAVLAFYFAEQLRGIEDSGFDIASSLRDIFAAFDPAKEAGRVAASADARARAAAARDARRSSPDENRPAVENPVTARLLEVQKLIAARDHVKAEAQLKQMLADDPEEPRVHYNLGRVAALAAAGIQDEDAQARKLVEAQQAYSNVIRYKTDTTDKALLSLTYVNLARIYEHFDNDDYAVRLYDEAIKLGEVPGGAMRDALEGKQRLLKQQ